MTQDATASPDLQPPLVIFGGTSFASLAAHCLQHDAGRHVLAFTVDRAYLGSGSMDGLPVLPFEDLPRHVPPGQCELLITLGYRRMNGLREERCVQAQAMGYALGSFVSRYARVWPDTPIGENVMVFEQAILQSHVRIGRNVIVRAGANIGHHSSIGEHSFIASGVVTGGNVAIGRNCFIGLGAVIRDGIRIGDRCFIGAGAVVTADTEADAVYVGNPARRAAKTALGVTR